MPAIWQRDALACHMAERCPGLPYSRDVPLPQCGVESIFVVVVSIVLFCVLFLLFPFVGLCYDVVDRDHVRSLTMVQKFR